MGVITTVPTVTVILWLVFWLAMLVIVMAHRRSDSAEIDHSHDAYCTDACDECDNAIREAMRHQEFDRSNVLLATDRE